LPLNLYINTKRILKSIGGNIETTIFLNLYKVSIMIFEIAV